MSWLSNMSDAQLEHTSARLRSDIDSFRTRAAAVAAHVEQNGLIAAENPLHKRLTGIQRHLCAQLVEAQEESARRRNARTHRGAKRFWRRFMPWGWRLNAPTRGADD